MKLSPCHSIGPWRLARVACCIFLLSSTLAAVAQQEQRVDLENIQALIEQTKAQLSKNLENSERIQQQLKLAELEIAQTITRINNTQQQLASVSARITELQQQESSLRLQVKNQQDLLSEQLRSAFMAGDYDYAKMFFNQEQARKMERVFVYYKYINTARQQKIDGFRQLIDEIQRIEQELVSQRQQLSGLQRQQTQQREQLLVQQQARTERLTQLNEMIENDQTRVARLEQQEIDLLRAIEQAEIVAQRAKQQQTMSRELRGLQGREGQLRMPVGEKMRALFGKRRQGQVTWKGVIFDAPSGSAVTTVDDGKVLYADWLKGFGLVIIIDHGQGYMSVYGHNQALLKSVGDYVREGESISLVGNSGGQNNSGLYFEIRHKGKALNPSTWIRRR